MYAPLTSRASLNSRRSSEGSVIRGNKVYSGESLVSWCCFGYSYAPVKSPTRSQQHHHSVRQQTNPYKTPPSGHIADSHYKPGSPRRRKDRTFNVLCQVREVLEKQYRISYPCKNMPHISKRFKVLSQFFGLEN